MSPGGGSKYEISCSGDCQTTDSLTITDRGDTDPVETTQTGPLMDRPDTTDADHVDDTVLQISSTGHWFLEVWIGDHSVEFLVDSGSSVTAMSDSGSCRSTGGNVGMYFKDTALCKWNLYWSVGMFSLRGVIHGTADGVSHTRLRPGHRYRCYYRN